MVWIPYKLQPLKPPSTSGGSSHFVIGQAPPWLPAAALDATLEPTLSLLRVEDIFGHILYIQAFTKFLHCSLLCTAPLRLSVPVRAFLTPFSHFVQGLPLFLHSCISESYTVSVNLSPLIFSTCPNYF